MRAYELREKFGIDALAVVTRPDPQPGRGQVLVKMRAFSLNYRDLLVIQGHYNPRMPLPRVPLSDGVGKVVAVGEGVWRVKVGDRVAGIFSQSWLDGEPTREKTKHSLGGEIDGVLAEYVVFDEQGVVPLPAHLSDEQAATLPCAGVTAWNALVTQGKLHAGETVLLLGTGGVSLFGLQFALMHGARTIITSKSDEKLQHAQKLGAHATINYVTTPDWEAAVVKLTDGRGVDHVVEVGGGGTLARSLRAVRLGGQIHLIGVLAHGAAVDPMPILMRSIRENGIFVGSRAVFEDMNRAIALHKTQPVVDRVFRFEEVPQALAYMQSGSHFGKIAVRVG